MISRVASSPAGTTVVLFGNWQIRHNEPLDASDRVLHAVAINDALCGDMTVTADLRGSHRLLATWTDAARFLDADARLECSNRGSSLVPLAVAQMQNGQVALTHLITRTELYRCVFTRPPYAVPVQTADDAFFDTVREAFAANHLALNNWECRYEFSPNVIVERFDIDSDCDVRSIGEAWYDLVDSSALMPFTTQCGDEFQLWDHNVTACLALPSGYASAEHWSRKRKDSLDEARAQLTRITAIQLGDPDTGTDSRDNDTGIVPPQAIGTAGVPSVALPFDTSIAPAIEAVIDEPVIESVAAKLDLPLQMLGEYRRLALATECESVDSGNVFSVTFETCVSLHDPLARVARGTIVFLKTRGSVDRTQIDKDLQTLREHVGGFLRANALDMLPSHPPFAFLTPHIAAERLASGAAFLPSSR